MIFSPHQLTLKAASTRNTDSLYSGGFDKAGKPYIARLYFSLAFKVARYWKLLDLPFLMPTPVRICGSLRTSSFERQGSRNWVLIPFQIKRAWRHHSGKSVHSNNLIFLLIPYQFAMDAANPGEFQVLGRLFLTTSTGALQLWQQDKYQWTREESLSTIEVAEFVELPEKVVSSSHPGDESYAQRLFRHVTDAQDLPNYLAKFARRFATGSYASASSSAAVQDGSLWRDAFGFRQVILVATRYGKLYALDSSNGAILWSRVLDLGWAAEIGASHTPTKIFVTRTVNDDDSPQAVLITQRRAG